ncbi:MAG: hypothetical protein COB98_03140 [Flavobacteriaceae bacterium]|nr:MAG: hypothetical protein COB98_03140 [Flavobacteriaceae bacterium]
MICIACNYEHKDKFCLNCGEKNGIKKLTFLSILQDGFLTITNMDKGFLFNLKALVLAPKKLTDDYISGKRKGIQNPISFLIVCVTIYLIVTDQFMVVPKGFDNYTKSDPFTLGVRIGEFIGTYLKYFWILMIIPLALSIKLTFKKFNFIENLAISAFVVGGATLVALFSNIIVSFFVFSLPLFFDPFVYLIIFWLLYAIFKQENNRVESFLLTLTGMILFVIQIVIIVVVLGVLLA